MSTSSGWQDPLGRPRASIARVVIAALAALAITGSAWPTQARSMRPSYDTSSVCHSPPRREATTDLSSSMPPPPETGAPAPPPPAPPTP